MTRKRNDEHSTEFGLWLRGELPNQKKEEIKTIDSSLGFITTNIDYLWGNYITHKWMLIEEKRSYGKHLKECDFPQQKQFQLLGTKLAKLNDKNYKGFHLIQFENTSPDDGDIYLDKKKITKEELILFLQFKYESKSWLQDSIDKRLNIFKRKK